MAVKVDAVVSLWDCKMNQLLLILFGGFIGCVCRIKLNGLFLAYSLDYKFPWVSFTVNLIGFLIIGFIAGQRIKLTPISADARFLFFSGLVGGFTIFSVLNLETIMLFSHGSLIVALAYIALNLLIGISMIGFGFIFSEMTT